MIALEADGETQCDRDTTGYDIKYLSADKRAKQREATRKANALKKQLKRKSNAVVENEDSEGDSEEDE